MEWLHGLGDDVIAFVNRDVLVVANLGSEPVALPAGAEVLLASIDPSVDADGSVLVPVGRHASGRATRSELHDERPRPRGGAVRAFRGARTRPTPAPSAAAR